LDLEDIDDGLDSLFVSEMAEKSKPPPKKPTKKIPSPAEPATKKDLSNSDLNALKQMEAHLKDHMEPPPSLSQSPPASVAAAKSSGTFQPTPEEWQKVLNLLLVL